VNYHVEHHLLMYVPCYNLPAFHKLLLAKGFGPRMEIQPDYVTVLKMAASKAESAADSVDTPADAGDTGNNHGAGIAFNITPRNDTRD
jgi:fatty acid desaturase